VNARKLDELPWHLRRSGRAPELATLLLTLEFCECKVRAGMVKELAEDFAAALQSMGVRA
jgi:hypothetical protein